MATVFAPRIITYVDVAPTIQNNDAYDANDVIFDKTLITSPTWRPGQAVVLNDIVWVDKNAQAAAAITFYFFDTAITTLGALDAAPSISDGDAATCLGKYILPSANMTALANNTIGSVHGIGMILKPVAGSTSIWVAATSAGTPTFLTASPPVLRFGFIG